MIKLHNRKGKRSPLFYAVWASPGIGVAANAQTYYFKYVIGDISAMTIVALVSIVGPFSIAAFPALSKKMGMRNLMASANMSIILSYTLLPALLYAIAALALRKFDLEKHLPEIQAELKKRKEK